jgi:hypothetical protein
MTFKNVINLIRQPSSNNLFWISARQGGWGVREGEGGEGMGERMSTERMGATEWWDEEERVRMAKRLAFEEERGGGPVRWPEGVEGWR